MLQYWPVLVVVLLGAAYVLFKPKSTQVVPAPKPEVPPAKDVFEQEVAKLSEKKVDSSVVVLDKPLDVTVELPVNKEQVASTLSHEANLHRAAAVQKQSEVDNHKMVADHLTKAVKELN
jgi:hypothetical protein